MAEPAAKPMSAAEFFIWQERQDVLYELVGGIPVPRSMTGATRRHDVVVINAIVAFGNKLRGSPCRAHTADVALQTGVAGLRRPDLTIDCGPMEPVSMTTGQPVLVLEVLSPSTAEIDRLIKLEEYKAVPSIRYILLADPGAPRVLLYERDEDGLWTSMSRIGLETVIEFAALGCSVSLAELYEDVPGVDTATPAAR